MPFKKYRKESNCLNCGAEVNGKFCSNCGQENIEIHENFFHLIWEYVLDAFNYDSKILRSLIPLITKPGFLTREFWDGKRASYIHPLRIFLYVTVLFVLVTTFFYEKNGTRFKNAVVFGDKSIEKIDSGYLASLKPTDKIFIATEKDSMSVSDVIVYREKQSRQLNKIKSGFDSVFVNLKYVTFFLAPVYALLFFLFFRKRRKFYVDHLIYSLHVQTFVYCVFMVLMGIMLLKPFSLETLRQCGFVIVVTYISLSIRNLYSLPWWRVVLNGVVLTGLLFMITGLTLALFAVSDAVFLE